MWCTVAALNSDQPKAVNCDVPFFTAVLEPEKGGIRETSRSMGNHVGVWSMLREEEPFKLEKKPGNAFPTFSGKCGHGVVQRSDSLFFFRHRPFALIQLAIPWVHTMQKFNIAGFTTPLFVYSITRTRSTKM
jgi:hypothetical protein